MYGSKHSLELSINANVLQIHCDKILQVQLISMATSVVPYTVISTTPTLLHRAQRKKNNKQSCSQHS